MEVVKNTEKMPITVPFEKFPRLMALRKSIEELKDLIEYLNKRKKFLSEDQDSVSDYQRNENKISVIKTNIELAKVHTSIIHKERDIKDYLDKVYYPFFNEIDTDWNALLEKAKEKSKKDGTLANVLNETDHSLFTDNWEHKFNFYIAVKNYLYPKKAKVVQKLKKVY
jgi:hypothetical protein